VDHNNKSETTVGMFKHQDKRALSYQ